VSKIVLIFSFLILILFSFACTRVVTLPVRTVVDWTEETKLDTESVFDFSQTEPEKND
jgi:hypothetical protein